MNGGIIINGGGIKPAVEGSAVLVLEPVEVVLDGPWADEAGGVAPEKKSTKIGQLGYV